MPETSPSILPPSLFEAKVFERRTPQTVVQLSRPHLHHNVGVFRSLLGTHQILCAVVKSDAYGHELACILPELVASGVHTFAVSCIDEARWIRLRYRDVRILLLCVPLAECLSEVLELHVEPCLNTSEDIRCFIAHFSHFQSRHLRAHIKIDTGMHRLGILPDEFRATWPSLPFLHTSYAVGVMTHLAISEHITHPTTSAQSQLFLDTLAWVHTTHPHIESHACNSAAVLGGGGPLLQGTHLVRVGIGLYGAISDARLKPVLAWNTTLSYVKHIPEGAYVGYGHTFQVQRPTRMGIVPVGYRLGYPAVLGNRVKVGIGDYVVPVMGRISMDLMAIDTTDVPLEDSVLRGHVVVLLSNQVTHVHALHVCRVAKMAHTIPYEIVCGIHGGIPRIWEETHEHRIL